MIRLLNDLFLLKEIDEIGFGYSASSIRQKYPHKIVVIRHVSYVYKDVLCEEAQKKLTDLSEYVLVGELAEHLGVTKRLLIKRIKFMEETSASFFEYIDFYDNYYVKLCVNQQKLLQEFQPFIIQLNEPENVVHSTLLGDLAIGFY